MAEKMSAAHGMTGMHKILEMACTQMKDGTCEGAALPPEGTVEHTFGRLYNSSTVLPDEDLLTQVAEKMEDDGTNAKDGPAEAGMAFLGQFIDHDLTLDATTELGKVAGDVTQIRNFRTPRLDLDCVYGAGQEVTPHFYGGPETDPHRGAKLIFGRRKDEGNGESNPLDLQRNRYGRALIGDPRNDENLFVSQVQGRMFIAQHNIYVDQHTGDDKKRYEGAKEDMLLFYHSMIINDFLPQIVSDAVLSPLVQKALHAASQGRNHLGEVANIDWEKAPDMPVEFSAAAFRFGHSMIRPTYKLNDHPGRGAVPIFRQAGDTDTVDLRGFAPVHEDNNLDMDLFFGDKAQRSRPIDTLLPASLLKLPAEIVTDEPNLAFRNMKRGQITFALPSGEVVAGNMGFDTIKPDHKLGDLIGNTPLWFYILSEAEQEGGGKLGRVGGTLVAGVLLNLMLRGESPYFFAKSGHFG